jgi:hypothetical protein
LGEFTGERHECIGPSEAGLTSLAGVTFAANQIPLTTADDVFSAISFTAIAQALAALTNYPAVKGAIELSQAITASSSTLAIDMSQGWNVALTLSASVSSITVSNWPASRTLGRFTLDVTSTGPFTLAGWPGTTRWTGGVAPTMTSGSGAKDTYILTSSDGGSTFRGFVAGQNMS